MLRALSLIGVNYRWGGNTPETGLDCSGLVRLLFHEAVGLVLPRRSEEMSREGSEIRVRDLRPGDLVFFNTLQRAFSHVGIYIGDRQFVHAPAPAARSASSASIDSIGTAVSTARGACSRSTPAPTKVATCRRRSARPVVRCSRNTRGRRWPLRETRRRLGGDRRRRHCSAG